MDNKPTYDLEPDHKMNFLSLTKHFKISTFICRFTLKREKEKRRNADILYEKMREQFREKEEQYNKEIEMKQQLELSLGTLDVELRTVRNNLDEVNL